MTLIPGYKVILFQNFPITVTKLFLKPDYKDIVTEIRPRDKEIRSDAKSNRLECIEFIERLNINSRIRCFNSFQYATEFRN